MAVSTYHEPDAPESSLTSLTMLIYVTMQPHLDSKPGSTVYALVLPYRGKWEEVEALPSALEGFGVFPRDTKRVDWSNLTEPLLLCALPPPFPPSFPTGIAHTPPLSAAALPPRRPYLGAETVVQDAHLLKLLITVLKGDFSIVTAGDLPNFRTQNYVRDGLCAVATASKKLSTAEPLSAETELLQVASPDASNAFKGGMQEMRSGESSACYLLSREVQEALNLVGKHEHLWRLLRAHDRHHHADRHLATHVAHVMRQEEGYVLVNGHPGFEDVLAMTGIINEPMADERPNVKMIQGYARFLPNGDPLLAARGLAQPAHAAEAWSAGILPPVGRRGAAAADAGGAPLSEKMVVYMTTRKAYSPEAELTVDYGASYSRNYSSCKHPVQRPLYDVPRDVVSAEATRTARFPALPGWWNPQLQPAERPAFQLVKERNGKTVVECVDDLPWLVQARKRALGLLPAVETAARPSTTAPRLGFAATKARRGEAPASKQAPKQVKLQAELQAGMVPQKPTRAAAAAAAAGGAARGGKAAAAAARGGKAAARGGKAAARGGKAAAQGEASPLRSSPWDAQRGRGALEWQCAGCSLSCQPSLAACAGCDTARPAADARDAGRGKRPREHDALEAPGAPCKRLAFGEQAPAASSIAKNLVSAFGFLRKVSREEAALTRGLI